MNSIVKKVYIFVGTFIGFLCFFSISLNVAMAQPMPSALSTPHTSPLDKKISYYVLQQTVALAIKDIGTQINVPVVIAPNVKGKVAAGKYKGTARELLDQMVADSNLHWYYDGRSIQVTAVQDAVMHIVQLSTFSFETLQHALSSIHLDTKGFPIRFDENSNMAIVYGPPKYVATIEVVAHHLATRAQQKPDVIRG